jgi:putative transposase
MVLYRRNYVPGGTFFFTVTLDDRRSSVLVDHVASLCAAFRNTRGEYALWQRRFWEHAIRDDRDFERCTGYIHFNPVKHGLVSTPGAESDVPIPTLKVWIQDIEILESGH